MSHSERAERFVDDAARARWHDEALWFVRAKRDACVRDVPEWEDLREAASRIKQATLARLAEHLERFEARARELGAELHWARDADEHNAIVLEILRERAVSRVVKSKSMLTEECGLNPFLEQHGIEVVDTDLGEYIVQLRGEPPSHIVLPAIHVRKEEVGELFHAKIGSPAGLADPTALTEVARHHLRARFLSAEAGITGVNFGVSETGGIVVCTNEGNADLGTSLPPLHIACLGIEKLVPRVEDLAVFLRLLARSATGQAITSYTSHFHGPRPDGELHIVLVDNGRSRILASPEFRRALLCIRCGACMNTCPVYRRSGGHSYEASIPGPIGSVLGPARDAGRHASLPYACTLCGSCDDVCPVKIDLHSELLSWRRLLAERGFSSARKRALLAVAAFAMRHETVYRIGTWLARRVAALIPRRVQARIAAPWARGRELPSAPRESFRELYARRRRS